MVEDNETVMVEDYTQLVGTRTAPKCDVCKVGDAQPVHVCVYSEEIGSSDLMCNCCEDCVHQCAMDI